MAFDDKTLSYFQELEVLKSLDEEKNKAFMDLLVFAILADDRVTDDELEQLDDELTRLPFLWDPDVRERVTDHSAKTREFLEENLDDDNRLEIFVGDIAQTISSQEHRRVALRMFAAVVVADGITETERERVFDVGHAFEFDGDTIEDILDDVSDTLGA